MSFPAGVAASSSHSGSILDVALAAYKKNTGEDLLSHPLAIEFQRCDSVDGILAILQRQANTFEQSRDGNGGLMKWIGTSVHILCSISGTLGDGLGVVSLRTPFCDPHFDVVVRHSHQRNRSLLELVFSSPSVSLPWQPFPFVHSHHTA